MIELSSKLLLDCKPSAMESCYKLYTWINDTVLILLMQILWKISQISEYFKDTPQSPAPMPSITPLSPLTKDYKYKRHIRSMSDVQSSTPYYNRIPYKLRKGSHPTLTSYDSDTRARRIRQYRPNDSSDSSDSNEFKNRSILEHNVMKHLLHLDSMGVL